MSGTDQGSGFRSLSGPYDDSARDERSHSVLSGTGVVVLVS